MLLPHEAQPLLKPPPTTPPRAGTPKKEDKEAAEAAREAEAAAQVQWGCGAVLAVWLAQTVWLPPSACLAYIIDAALALALAAHHHSVPSTCRWSSAQPARVAALAARCRPARRALWGRSTARALWEGRSTARALWEGRSTSQQQQRTDRPAQPACGHGLLPTTGSPRACLCAPACAHACVPDVYVTQTKRKNTVYSTAHGCKALAKCNAVRVLPAGAARPGAPGWLVACNTGCRRS